MASSASTRVAQLALGVGAVLLASLVSLLLFFTIAGPFGAINDWLIGLSGLLTIALALVIRSWDARSASSVAMVAAVLGGAIVTAGAGLVISKTTGFLLAGLVESVGFALVGWWVIAVSRSGSAAAWPARLRTLGLISGVLLLIGLAAIPGVLAREDDMATASTLVWVAFVGWLGAFIGYPLWAIWLSRVIRGA